MLTIRIHLLDQARQEKQKIETSMQLVIGFLMLNKIYIPILIKAIGLVSIRVREIFQSLVGKRFCLPPNTKLKHIRSVYVWASYLGHVYMEAG